MTRILVVDDSADSAESLGALLRLAGHAVQVVQDGAAAIALAKRFRPQAVILDIGMPEMDGYEVARRLRRLPGLETVRLIALTGYGQDPYRQEAAAAGFDHYLVKPVDFRDLREALALMPLRSPEGETTAT